MKRAMIVVAVVLAAGGLVWGLTHAMTAHGDRNTTGGCGKGACGDKADCGDKTGKSAKGDKKRDGGGKKDNCRCKDCACTSGNHCGNDGCAEAKAVDTKIACCDLDGCACDPGACECGDGDCCGKDGCPCVKGGCGKNDCCCSQDACTCDEDACACTKDNGCCEDACACCDDDGTSRAKGKVKWYNAAKGFGFITMEGEERDVFVQQSSIRSDGNRALTEDEDVEFDLVEKSNGLHAENVTRTTPATE